MGTLLRVHDLTVLDTLPGIQQAILDHRQQPMTEEQADGFMTAVEALVNTLLAAERPLAPTHDDQEFQELQGRLQEAEENTTIAENVANDLRRQLEESRAIQVALASTRPAAGDPNAAARIPDPEMFSGEKDKLRAFSVQLRLKTQTITDEQARLRYAVSRLSGSAFDQIVPFVLADRINITDTAALLHILEAAFGDPDRAATAARKINTLRQANRDFATYYAEFARYAADLDWNESAKLAALRHGLSSELKMDMIPLTEEPTTIAQLVTVCQRLDNRRRALQQEGRTRGPMTPASRTTTTTTTTPRTVTPAASSPSALSTATGTQPGPMDLSANRRRLSPEERQRRMTEGRCLYCGGLGHMAATCPVARRPLRAAEVLPAPAPLPLLSL